MNSTLSAQPEETVKFTVGSDLRADKLSDQAKEFEDQEDFQSALDNYNKSIRIKRSNPNPRLKELARDLIRAGYCYIQLGNTSGAQEYLNEALGISQKIVARKLEVSSLDNLGISFELQNKFSQSIKHYKKAILIFKNLGDNSGMATDIFRIGRSYFYWGRYPEARKYLKEAEKRFDNISSGVSGRELNDILAFQENCRQLLTAVFLKMNKVENAFLQNETCITKVHDTRYSSVGKTLPTLSVDQLQLELSEQSAVLIYANSGLKNPVIFTVTKRKVRAREINLKDFASRVQNRFSIELDNLRSWESRIKWFNSPAQRELKLFGNPAFGEILSLYSSLLSSKSSSSSDAIKIISRELFDLLIKPIYHEIREKNELTIIPNGILSSIPFEALLDESGHYLVEYHQITYSPAAAMIKLNKKRKYSADRKPILTIGNPGYLQSGDAGENISNSSQLKLSLNEMWDTPLAEYSAAALYSALGVKSWQAMPGTESEIDGIKGVFSKTEALVADRASEKIIKNMSDDGDLLDYQVIHFATRGVIMHGQPELSGVVLSHSKLDAGGNDGYLRLQEIADLKLRADLITLSHIDPGFGSRINNPGVFDLAQAFAVSGARGISVSLWQPDQEDVNRFILHVYESIVEQGFNFARANTEAKRYFISGAGGSEFKNPHYWASMVFHGDHTEKTFLTPPKIALLISQGKQVSPTTRREPIKPVVLESEKPEMEEVDEKEVEIALDEPVIDEIEDKKTDIEDEKTGIEQTVDEKTELSEVDESVEKETEVTLDKPDVEDLTVKKQEIPEADKPVVKESDFLVKKPEIDKPTDKKQELPETDKPDVKKTDFVAEKPDLPKTDKLEVEESDYKVSEPAVEKPVYEEPVIQEKKDKPEIKESDFVVKKPVIEKPADERPEVREKVEKETEEPETKVDQPVVKKTTPGKTAKHKLAVDKPARKKPFFNKPPVLKYNQWDFVTDEHASEEFTPLVSPSPEAYITPSFDFPDRIESVDREFVTAAHDAEEFTPLEPDVPEAVEPEVRQPEVVVEEPVDEKPVQEVDATPEVVVEKPVKKEPVPEKEPTPEVKKDKPYKPVQTRTQFSGTYKQRYQHALELYEAGKHDEAEDQFLLLLEEDDSNSLSDNCQYWIGECQYAKGEYDDAYVEFDKVHNFKNSNKVADAEIMMEKCRRRTGKTLKKSSSTKKPQLVQAPVKQPKKKPPIKKPAAEPDEKKPPLASETELFSGPDKALQEITYSGSVQNKPVSTSSVPYQKRYSFALKNHENGNYEAAVRQFQEMLDENNQHDLADNCQYWIGECYYKMGKYDIAIVEFERVLEYENTNKNEDALTMIGRSRWKLQHNTKTEYAPEPTKPPLAGETKKVTKVTPKKKKTKKATGYEGKYNQAIELIEADNRPEALPILKGLLKESRKHELSDNCQYWIGEITYEAGSYEQALVEFRKVLDDYRNSNKTEDATYMIARCYHKMNDPDKAVELYKLFIEVFPESPRIDKAKYYLGRLSR